MIRLAELKLVLGRRLAVRLLQAQLVVPSGRDARGQPLFDAQSLHRTLGRLARAVGLIEARTYQPGNGRGRGSEKDQLDAEEALAELARLLE